MLLGIELLKKHDIYIDKAVSNHCYDYNKLLIICNIQDIMDSFKINDPKQVLKVDDVANKFILEGLKKQAGCCTVGVARWSVNMDVSSYDEKYNLNEKTINHKLKKTRQLLSKKEPTYLINTLTELKHCIVPLYLKN